MEAVTRERGVIDFEVQPELVFESVAVEKGAHRRRIVIVLMLGRLVRLRLQEQGPLEADAMLVFDDEMQEARELRLLAAEFGEEQGVVALAPAPEDVIGAPPRRASTPARP